MTTCRSCKAEVVFVPSAKTGKPMILNAEPMKGIVIDHERVETYVGEPSPDSGARLRISSTGHVASVVDVYTDHHATCPQAEAWR